MAMMVELRIKMTRDSETNIVGMTTCVQMCDVINLRDRLLCQLSCIVRAYLLDQAHFFRHIIVIDRMTCADFFQENETIVISLVFLFQCCITNVRLIWHANEQSRNIVLDVLDGCTMASAAHFVICRGGGWRAT